MFKTRMVNNARATSGSWVAYAPNTELEGSPIARFKVVRIGVGNAELSRIMKEFEKLQAVKDNDEQQARLAKFMSDNVVKDWENVSVDGELIPYSTDECYKLLIAAPDMLSEIQQMAMNFENFNEQLKRVEETIKN